MCGLKPLLTASVNAGLNQGLYIDPMEWLTNKAGKFALKEALGVVFIGACALAKIAPIFDDGNYKADAVLYMLLAAMGYYLWTYWS